MKQTGDRAQDGNGSRRRVDWKHRWGPAAFLLALSVVALLPAAPFLNRTPNNDYSIFFYVGREMVKGEMLYLDVYDHKPPLIFIINAAGILLGGGQSSGGRWGVWAFELVSLAVAVVLAYRFLERYFSRLPALVALSAALMNLAFLHERGNLTEEYAFPFQFGALYLLAGGTKSSGEISPSARRFLAIGVLLGLASSLKQTMAGIGAAIVVYLAFDALSQPPRRWRDLLRSLFWMAAGAASVWGVWLAVFALAGIFPEFWEAVFLLNFGISSLSTPERLQALSEAFRWLTGSSGLFLGGMLIWLTVVPYLVLYDNRTLSILSGRLAGFGIGGLGLFLLYNGLFRSGLDLYALADLSPYRFGLIAAGLVLVGSGGLFLSGWAGRCMRGRFSALAPAGRSDLALPAIIALVDLPVAFGLAILTGQNFPHYFMPLLPALVILFAYGVYLLVQPLEVGGSATRRRGWLAGAWLAALMLPVFVPGIQMTFQQLHPRGDRQVEDTAAYLAANTLPGEPVLQWGIMSSVYILSNRSAPTRYFTTNPLFFDGYSGEWQTSRLLADLRARPPVVIVDTMMVRLPLVTAPLPAGGDSSAGWQDCTQVQDPAYARAFLEARRGPAEQGMPEESIPQLPAGIGDVYDWICQNYRPVGSVGELNWQVYRLKGK